MRAKFVAVLIVVMAVIPMAYADDWQPEWLPPTPAARPFWTVTGEHESFGADATFNEMFYSPVRDDFGKSSNPLIVRFNLANDASGDLGRWTAKQEAPDCRDLRDLPASPRDWKTEHALDMPLPIERSLFMFGEVNANGDVDQTTSKVKGRTGLGWKVMSFTGGELLVRTGPVVTYEDLPQTQQTLRSQLSVELQAKVALVGPLQLKYVGEALPALAQTDRNTYLQDLKIALPLGTNREFSLGAKYRWDDSLAPTPWTQRAELYMGFKFER